MVTIGRVTLPAMFSASAPEPGEASRSWFRSRPVVSNTRLHSDGRDSAAKMALSTLEADAVMEAGSRPAARR